MKATHDIKSPAGGTVSGIFVKIGQEIEYSTPLMTIA
jgi:biotin carboxyl carrier protein